MKRWVVDTNELVSALLTPHGVSARVLEAVLTGDICLLVDARIVSEYRAVLARPKFGFAPEPVAVLLDYLRAEGAWVAGVRPLRQSLPDPDDAMFLGVALAGAAEGVVTRHLKHFPASCCDGVRVLSPAQWWAGLAVG